MIKNIVLAFCAMILLIGCSSKGKSPCTSGNVQEYDQTRHVLEFETNIGDRVFFALNSSEIAHAGMKVLHKQAYWLDVHKNFNITIEGHCDERGTKEVNIALGERRAEAVKKVLVKYGVDAHRIQTVSYGKERPAVIGHDEEAWAQNRRVVTSIK